MCQVDVKKIKGKGNALLYSMHLQVSLH